MTGTAGCEPGIDVSGTNSSHGSESGTRRTAIKGRGGVEMVVGGLDVRILFKPCIKNKRLKWGGRGAEGSLCSKPNIQAPHLWNDQVTHTTQLTLFSNIYSSCNLQEFYYSRMDVKE